jgi:hypothetical protein
MMTDRTEHPTIRTLALPAADHPIWAMGHAHTTVAYAVCAAFFALAHGWR